QDQVKSMSSEQAQECLLEVMRQLMIKDNVIRHLVKKSKPSPKDKSPTILT
ncbi:MAG: hypothetical protein HC860_03600, partial [Alkalinema sp. RU_4_3]|nr:hypothetical protein [Alkalinema sp. RU_4_3]